MRTQKKKANKKSKTPRREISEEYYRWRWACLERDNYTCVKCGRKPRRVVVHHILSYAKYPDLRYDVNNGATMCRYCHKTFHMKFGLHKFTKENFEEFIKGNSNDQCTDGESTAV